MADKDINIVVKLKDEFTSRAEKIQISVDRLGKSVESAGKTMEKFGSKMAFIGGATTGAFLVAMKNIEGASLPVQRTFQELENVMRNFQISIANSVEPAFQKLVNISASLVDAWNELDPAARATILQFTFLGGAALIAFGAVLKLVGSVVSLAGKLTSLLALAVNPMVIALGLMSLAVVEMVKNWERVREVVLPIMNSLQIAADMVAIGFWKIVEAMGRLLRVETPLATASIKSLQESLQKAIEGKGSLAEFVDKSVKGTQNVAKSFEELAKRMEEAMKRGGQNSKAAVVNWASFAQQTVQRMADGMAQSTGNFFYNVLTGQINSAKQAFVEFGNTVLRILSDVMARVLLQKTLAGPLSGLFGNRVSFFHSGGPIKKAHSGMLAQDEVPIVAQDGEGVLSRQGMSRLGSNNLRRLNRGESVGGGGSYSPVLVIQAWDTRDIQRNRKQIEDILISGMKKNSPIRGAMKQYA